MSDLLTRQNAVFRRLLFLGALITLGIIIFRQLSFFTGAFLGTTYSFTANILMTVVILYFMLSAGRRMEAVLIRYLPFSG